MKGRTQRSARIEQQGSSQEKHYHEKFLSYYGDAQERLESGFSMGWRKIQLIPIKGKGGTGDSGEREKTTPWIRIALGEGCRHSQRRRRHDPVELR